MSVSCECFVLSLRRGYHSSRGLLPNVVSVTMISTSEQWAGVGLLELSSHGEKKKLELGVVSNSGHTWKMNIVQLKTRWQGKSSRDIYKRNFPVCFLFPIADIIQNTKGNKWLFYLTHIRDHFRRHSNSPRVAARAFYCCVLQLILFSFSPYLKVLGSFISTYYSWY
jgi:hypothetical protein